MSKGKVAIVGGSIAGCALAIAMQRSAVEVVIYERSSAPLEDRGAGICMPLALHQALVEHDYLDADIPCFPIAKRQFIRKGDDRRSDIFWEQPFPAMAYHWGDLFANLKKRLQGDIYHQGEKIVSFTQTKDVVSVTLEDGATAAYDQLFACDGASSLLREQLFPDNKPQVANYVAWRGLTPSSKITPADYFSPLTYMFYKDGHALLYCIPGDGFTASRTENKNLKTIKQVDPTAVDSSRFDLNWLVYQKVSDAQLQQLFPVASDGHAPGHQSLTISGRQFDKRYHHLLQQLQGHLAPEMQQVVDGCEHYLLQKIVDVQIPSLLQGRVALCGDAAFVTRPHTGGGASKVIQGALLLQKELHQENDISVALDRWSQQQWQQENMLYHLGQGMGHALVEDMPHWHTMSEEDIQLMWKRIMQGKKWYV